MATITKRGKRWSVQIRRLGTPTLCRTFASRKEAAAWALTEEGKIEQGQSSSQCLGLRKVTLGDVIDRYSSEVTLGKRSASTERLRLMKLRRHPLCDNRLDVLSSVHLALYRDSRSKLVKAGTVRRELSLLHHALEIAKKEWGIPLQINPVKDVSLPSLRNARDRRLEEGELERLLSAAAECRSAYLVPAVRLALETGLRRGELLNLTWANIDLTRRVAHIPQTKTGRPRTIPLTDDAVALLSRLKGSQLRVFSMTANALKLSWRRAVARAELRDLRFHDLRHEAISRFFELGLTVPEVALISGHRDARMLMRYTHLRPADLARKLAGMRWQSVDAR